MLNTKKTRALLALTLAVPLFVGMTACGSSGTPNGGSTPGAQGSTFDTFEEYQLAFAECMRGKGIDMGDPNNGSQSFTSADEAFTSAADDCQAEIGAPPARDGGAGTDSGTADTLRQEHLAIAECLREHGVDVADPAVGENLDVPVDVPIDAIETCAPNGVVGTATGGN